MPRLRISIAARLAASYGVLVMIAVSTLSGVFYAATVGVLERGIDRKIAAISAQLVASFDTQRLDELVTALTDELGDGADSDTEILLLLGPDGRVLAGNLEKWKRFDVPHGTLDTASAKRRGQRIMVRYIMSDLGDGIRLVVGRDMQEQQAIRELVRRAIAVGAVVALALVFGGAIFFRAQLERRIGEIRRTAHEIESGDLSRRMPVPGDDEFGRLAEDINHMLDRIEQLMNGVRHVSNSIAHDLRTPLTRIRSQLDDALRHAHDAAALRDAIATATTGIDDLIALFNKLLQIAETESGVRARNFAAVDLDAIAEDMVELYDASAEEQGVTLALTRRDGQPTQGDHDLLASALASLLDNSIKYAGRGARIEVGVEADADSVSVVVRDDGPGIPLAEIDRVTERFYRVDRSRSLPGNGLGLAIVAAIATFHDGRLELSDAAPGLLARLVVPRREAAASRAPATGSAHAPRAGWRPAEQPRPTQPAAPGGANSTGHGAPTLSRPVA
ncbi:MAG: HAMP domain-containing sensor histidine kinase [Gammaproteobacteria bacterium]